MQVRLSTKLLKTQSLQWLRRSIWTLVILSLAIPILSQAQSYNVLTRFENGNGGSPIDIVQGTDGNYYGVGITGGNNAGGSVFKVTPTGDAGRLYTFCATAPCRDGKTPNGLILASDGNFYGTTRRGGLGDSGTVFRMTQLGSVATIYNFCATPRFCTEGRLPSGELIEGTDGNLYGTTALGGQHGRGTVFKITPSGVFTTVYNFCSQSNCTDGASPTAGLLQASNGNIYGTTAGGGTNGCCGTIFRMTSSGTLTTLYTFCAQPNCPDGIGPQALIQGTGGIYGFTMSGGLGDCSGGCGTIFRMPLGAGSVTVLHSFTTSEGLQVQKLIQATDGNLYGTARSGGSSGLGTFFKMDSTGSVAVLFNFCNNASCKFSTNPAGLIQSTNGLFYGTTTGPGNGVVFTYGFPPFITMSPSFGPIGRLVKIYGTDLSGATAVTFNGGAQAAFTIVAPGEIDASVPPGALYGPVKVTTPAGILVSNVVFRITP